MLTRVQLAALAAATLGSLAMTAAPASAWYCHGSYQSYGYGNYPSYGQGYSYGHQNYSYAQQYYPRYVRPYRGQRNYSQYYSYNGGGYGGY